MKTKSIINKAKKMGYKIAGDDIHPTNSNKVMHLMHNANSDDVFAIHIARADDKIDTITDYFPGSFYHSIKSAFEAVA